MGQRTRPDDRRNHRFLRRQSSRTLAHYNLHAPIDDMGIVESLHQVVFHWIIDDLHRRFSAKEAGPATAARSWLKRMARLLAAWASRSAAPSCSSGSGEATEALAGARTACASTRHAVAAGIREQIQAGLPSPARRRRGSTAADRRPSASASADRSTRRTGRIQKSYQVAGWEGFPLASWAQRRIWAWPVVVVENDCDVAGLAEARLGAGVGYSPLLYVTVGSGDRRARSSSMIGSTAGFGLGAVEIGHLMVPETLNSENRGRRAGASVASGWAIASAAQEVARRLLAAGQSDWIVLARAHGQPGQITAAIGCSGRDRGRHGVFSNHRSCTQSRRLCLDTSHHPACASPHRHGRGRVAHR